MPETIFSVSLRKDDLLDETIERVNHQYEKNFDGCVVFSGGETTRQIWEVELARTPPGNESRAMVEIYNSVELAENGEISDAVLHAISERRLVFLQMEQIDTIEQLLAGEHGYEVIRLEYEVVT